MNVLLTFLLAVQLLSAIAMVGLILVQHGKGADAGAAFGGGGAGSATLFGASGGANFLSRSTAALATVFLTCTLALAYFGNARPSAPSGSVLENLPPTTVPAVPQSQIPDTVPAPPGNASQIPGQ
jgi:preprotein translocase subunit SecG